MTYIARAVHRNGRLVVDLSTSLNVVIQRHSAGQCCHLRYGGFPRREHPSRPLDHFKRRNFAR